MVGAKAMRRPRLHTPQEKTMRTTQFLTTAPLFALGACAAAERDLAYWDCAYGWRPSWWSGWGRRWGRGWGGDWGIASGPVATQYTEGTVLVDVFDPKTKDLLWRGQGVAAVSDNQAQYEQELKKT